MRYARLNTLGRYPKTFKVVPDTGEPLLPDLDIDVGRAHFWDLSAVGALDTVVVKFRREGTEVEILGMNEASATLVDRLGVHDKPDAVERLMGH